MVNALQLHGKEILIRGGLIKTARLKDEWYQDVEDPQAFITALQEHPPKADLFTFWQRPTDTRPRHPYYLEWDPVATLSIHTYAHWFETQINKGARYAIRNASRKGVTVKIVAFDDDLIQGITAIYNETPVRQGRRFPHYGKSLATVALENSTYLDRSEFIGAYYRDQLIGFIKLTYMEDYADPMQIISTVRHRDKSPTNALLAKAVERCSERGIPYLFYGSWDAGGLGDFKRNNGFDRLDLPRYYIPLTTKGTVALKANVHHGVRRLLPPRLVQSLIDLRRKWYSEA